MKSIYFLLCIAALMAFNSCSSGRKLPKNVNQWKPSQQLSYAYGHQIASNLVDGPLLEAELDPEQVAAGFMKGLEADSMMMVRTRQILEERFQGEGIADSNDIEAAKKIAYHIGISMIGDLVLVVPIPVSDFNKTALAAGFDNVVKNEPLKMSTAQMDSVFSAYFDPKAAIYQAKMEERKDQETASNMAEGKAFLEKNKTKEGVITTPSGLQYEILREGTGQQPTAEDRVEVHYKGTLLDGTVFDNSYERGEPISFGLMQVIPGWTEGVALMKEGAHYRFYIPQELAYGLQSPTPAIPPGSTLIFEVELLKVEQE